jgi:hypothetical protein
VTATVGAGNEVAAATGMLVAGSGATVWVGGTAVSVALGDSVTVAVIVTLANGVPDTRVGVVVMVGGPDVTLANGVPDTRVGVVVMVGSRGVTLANGVPGTRVGIMAVGGAGTGVSFSFGGGTDVDLIGVRVGTVCRSGLCSGVAHTALTDSDAAKMMPNAKMIKTRSDFIVHLYCLESRKCTSI